MTHQHLLAGAALAAAATLAGAPIAAADHSGCDLPYASGAEETFVHNVTRLTTGVTCLEARSSYRNNPTARNSLPYSITYTAAAWEDSNALDDLPAPVQSCRVTTTARVRNNLGMTMATVSMVQWWDYNKTRVWPATPRVVPGDSWLIYSWNGVVTENDWYVANGTLPLYTHNTEKFGKYEGTLGPVGTFGTIVRLLISKDADGDWYTLNDLGLAGCEDND